MSEAPASFCSLAAGPDGRGRRPGLSAAPGIACSSAPAPARFFAIARRPVLPAPFPGRGALFPAGTPSRPFRYRPARFFSAPFHGAGRSLPGRYSFEALSLSAGPVLLRTFSRGGVLPSRPALLRGPFVAVRCPFLLLPGALPFRPAGAPSGLPVPLRDFRRYRAAANSLSRAISSGQRSSSGVSRMSGMPSKRASEAM